MLLRKGLSRLELSEAAIISIGKKSDNSRSRTDDGAAQCLCKYVLCAARVLNSWVESERPIGWIFLFLFFGTRRLDTR